MTEFPKGNFLRPFFYASFIGESAKRAYRFLAPGSMNMVRIVSGINDKDNLFIFVQRKQIGR